MKFMPNSRAGHFPVLISLFVIILITAPYIYAILQAGDAYQFSGFLVNPLDGNSYLAKMHQGWAGNWSFKLPYTAEPGEGTYINLFYLSLGHFSRITNMPLVVVYHLARIVGSIMLLSGLWHYLKVVSHDPQVHRTSFAIAALGSGMGWILAPFGILTADLWVSEAYPLLSAFTNPHFPIGLALMLWLLASAEDKIDINEKKQGIKRALITLVLGIISPFGVVVVFVVICGIYVMRGFQKYLDDRTIAIDWLWSTLLSRLMPIILGGFPILIYDFYVVHIDEILSIWNNQNQTLTVHFLDILISLSPFLPVAAITFFWALFRKREELHKYHNLILWAGLGVILIYMPFSLQRRFMMGLYIPFVGSAVSGLSMMWGDNRSRFRKISTLLFLLALPTNIVLYLALHHGIQNHDEIIYLRRDEVDALMWISNNTPSDGLIAASPDMGLFIPAHTGRRVIYGHPFETANAKSEKHALTQFFRADLSQSEAISFLMTRGVDYIFYGPREEKLGSMPSMGIANPIYKNETVVIMEVGD